MMENPEAIEAIRDCVAVVAKPNFSKRFWWALGYGMRSLPPSVDDIPEAHRMPGWFLTEVDIRFSMMDRLRLLLAGKARMRIENRANVVVDEVISVTYVSIVPPTEKLNRINS